MGTNVALYKTATASDYIQPFEPALAVNGTSTTIARWVSNLNVGSAAKTHWFQVNLGGYYFINRYVLVGMGTLWNNAAYNNVSFTCATSTDGSSWAPVDTVANNSATTYDKTFSTTGVIARYVKITFTNGLSTNSFINSIVELQVYTHPSALLSNLVLSNNAVLNPVFASNTLNYTSVVNYNMASVTVTPTSVDPVASIKVNNVTVASGTPSAAINLNPGDNQIQVNVSDEGQSSTYTVTVSRYGPYLKNLVPSIGQLTPAFSTLNFNYAETVDRSVSSMALTPTALDPAAAITVNGSNVASGSSSQPINLNFGTNSIPVVVTENGQTQTYTVNVQKPSTKLSSLAIKSGRGTISPNPTFTPDNLNYTESFASNQLSQSFVLTTEDPQATVIFTLDGNTVSGSGTYAVTLTPANHTIQITVKGCDGVAPASPYNIALNLKP
jgi:hypothetical protein